MVQWLPVLANTEPPALRCKAAVEKLIENQLYMKNGHYTTVTVFLLHEILCHHADLFSQTLIPQTLPVSGKIT